MVLLQKITEAAIVDNLKKRFMDDCIYVSFVIFIGDIIVRIVVLIVEVRTRLKSARQRHLPM